MYRQLFHEGKSWNGDCSLAYHGKGMYEEAILENQKWNALTEMIQGSSYFLQKLDFKLLLKISHLYITRPNLVSV
jgi:hypothetical protein